MLRLNLIDRAALRRRRLFSLWKPAAGIAAAGAAIWLAHADATLRKASRELDESMARAEVRLQRARSAPQDADAVERMRAGVEQRIAALERAARRESAGVAFHAVVTAFPAGAWLTELKQERELVTVRGIATSPDLVARLAARLDEAAVFMAPVEITGAEAVSDPRNGELVNFVLVGRLHG
jgi:Tfp pilus assembly protein PilN